MEAHATDLISMPGSADGRLSLAADAYNRYPGEDLCLYVRVRPPAGAAGTLQLILPGVMRLEAVTGLYGEPANPSLIQQAQETILNLPLDGFSAPGGELVFSIQARLQTYPINHFLTVEARLVDGEGASAATEAIQVAVYAKGKYLQYLPEIYESDDFTGRFLMLFESFWKPVSQQIDQVDAYFDPGLTPAAFVPWLASWLGLPADETLPLERLRRLLKSAMMLYQCRGTRQALQTFLALYTDGKVEIVEQRARNFVLGPGSTLGAEIALGKQNRPNSLVIKVTTARSELERLQFSPETYRRKLVDIVRSIVPAHVSYEVKYEAVDSLTEKGGF